MKSPYERSYISLAMRSQEYDCTSTVQDIVQGIEMIHNSKLLKDPAHQPNILNPYRQSISLTLLD